MYLRKYVVVCVLSTVSLLSGGPFLHLHMDVVLTHSSRLTLRAYGQEIADFTFCGSMKHLPNDRVPLNDMISTRALCVFLDDWYLA